MSIHQKAYRYRLQPTPEQAAVFLQWAGARRFAYNWALARRKAYYRETGKTLSYNALARELTALKRRPETAWLLEMNAQSLQQALRDLDKAFGNFFATLSERTWTCDCGMTHDRDLNAACNIRDQGLKLLLAGGSTDSLNASGGSVSPATRGHGSVKGEAPPLAAG